MQKPKGSKHKSTLLKETIGLDNWQKLADYMRGEGAGKMISQLRKFNGKNYFTAYSNLLEFFEPKKQRIDAQVGHGTKETFFDFLKATSSARRGTRLSGDAKEDRGQGYQRVLNFTVGTGKEHFNKSNEQIVSKDVAVSNLRFA